MNKLNDLTIKKAKPEAKPYKLTDGDGLYLLVEPKGGKYWRMAYRFGGKCWYAMNITQVINLKFHIRLVKIIVEVYIL